MAKKDQELKNKYKGKECSYLPVYCTDHDLHDATVLRLALSIGAITKESYHSLIHGNEMSVIDKSQILEALFGFCKGNYDAELVAGFQKNRIGGKLVEGVIRYTGVERMDKDWVESSMASEEVVQLYKFGETL